MDGLDLAAPRACGPPPTRGGPARHPEKLRCSQRIRGGGCRGAPCDHIRRRSGRGTSWLYTCGKTRACPPSCTGPKLDRGGTVRLRPATIPAPHRTQRSKKGIMTMSDALPAKTGDTLPPLSDRSGVTDAVRTQILATEHWSLLATRSMTWNEVFSRASMFITVLSAASWRSPSLLRRPPLGQISTSSLCWCCRSC